MQVPKPTLVDVQRNVALVVPNSPVEEAFKRAFLTIVEGLEQADQALMRSVDEDMKLNPAFRDGADRLLDLGFELFGKLANQTRK